LRELSSQEIDPPSAVPASMNAMVIGRGTAGETDVNGLSGWACVNRGIRKPTVQVANSRNFPRPGGSPLGVHEAYTPQARASLFGAPPKKLRVTLRGEHTCIFKLLDQCFEISPQIQEAPPDKLGSAFPIAPTRFENSDNRRVSSSGRLLSISPMSRHTPRMYSRTCSSPCGTWHSG